AKYQPLEPLLPVGRADFKSRPEDFLLGAPSFGLFVIRRSDLTAVLFNSLVGFFKYRIGDHRHSLRRRSATGKLAPQRSQTRRRRKTQDLMGGDKGSECDGATGRRGDGARLVHSICSPFASSPRLPVAPSPRRRLGQRSERYILQRAIGDDHQPLLAQPRCDWAEQNPAQSVRPFRSFRGGPGQPRSQLSARFPSRQPSVRLARQRFDFGPFWQLEALDPGRRHGPEITALL